MKKILKTWLSQQCQMLPGATHAVMLTGAPDEGPYDQAFYWPGDQHDHASLQRVTKAALDSKQVVVKTRNNTADETGEPLDALACPLFMNGKLFGVVGIEMTSRSQSMQQATVQQLQAGAKWLDTMTQLQGQTVTDQLVNLVDLVAVGLENENFQVAATEVANELCVRFDCQKVSLGFKSYNRIRVEAISHSTKVDQQSSFVQMLRDAMNEAMDQEATVVYPLQTKDDLLITCCHALLSKSTRDTSLCTVPLIKNAKVVGALCLERAKDKPFDCETISQCKQIGLLIGPVLEIRRQEERPLPAKILHAMQTWLGKLFGPKHLPLKSVVAVSIAGLIWLSLASGTMSISSASLLEAEVCRVVVAPQQGHIAEAPVRAGALVREGEVLATMDDRDLQLELRKWQSQRAQLLKEYRKALASFDRAEVAILNAKRAQAEAQIRLVEQKLERTVLVAPFPGLVIKGDLSQSLGSPVERGEILFEVAQTDSYRVVLEVDDRDIGLISVGQRGKMKLSGLPDQLIDIEIERITPISASEDGRNYFRVEAVMDNDSDLMRPGMEGVAKINVGDEKLLWIWSRRLVGWLQLFAWNRLP